MSMVLDLFASKLFKELNTKSLWEFTQSTLYFIFRKLKAAGFRLLSHYDDLQEDENKQKNLVLISSSGRP